MAGNEWMGAEERNAIVEVMDRGSVLFRYGFDGRRKNVFVVKSFEEECARFLGCVHAQAVSSGSAALRVALAAAGIGKGDEVIVPCFTFVATVEAVIESGATPVIAEIDPSLNLDPRDIEKRITSKTKAMIPVHMLGVAADMDAILAIARRRKLIVIEDTAQACGSTYHGKRLGTLGHMGTFSFDYVKTMTCGEGGLVATNSKKYYERSAQYSDHGHMHDASVARGLDPKEICGFNFRMTEIQAAIGRAQLQKLPAMIQRQRENKNIIRNTLQNISGLGFRPQSDPEGDGGDTLIVRFENAKTAGRFSEKIASAGIATKILPDALGWHFFANWPQIYLRLPKYAKKKPKDLFPRSREILSHCVAFPISLEMPAIHETASKIRGIALECIGG